jgi:phytoene synthase
MTRNSSFYYSFLVLPAPQRRAIIAVFDFAAPLTTASISSANSARRGRRQDGAPRSRGCSAACDPRRPKRRQPQPFVGACGLPREEFDALVDGVSMDIRPRRYARLPNSSVLSPRGGRRSD